MSGEMNPSSAEARGKSVAAEVEERVWKTLVMDPHTHLYDPAFGGLVSWGIDDLLIYHYLVAETFRHARTPYDEFWALDKRGQADFVWRHLFLESSPISEACRGVLTTLSALDLDPRRRDLESIRQWFAGQNLRNHTDRCLKLAGVRRLCMTNSPFDEAERVVWSGSFTRDERFAAGLRIDPLLLNWEEAQPKLKGWGYDVEAGLNDRTVGEARRFLEDWSGKIDAWYLMVSLPPEFNYPSANQMGGILEKIVLPHCRDHGLPLALMPGVRRGMNPALRLAGDGSGSMDAQAIARLCAAWPENKFMATVLARENQHEICVIARKFRNLHLFGCWWFLNVPSLVEEITEMRLELLGATFTAQHSDARVLDQVIYKWKHFRDVLARVLSRKYQALSETGWEAGPDEIARDVAALLGEEFEAFCGRA
jgi:hypothetical protein